MPATIGLDVATPEQRKSSAALYIMHLCYPGDRKAQNKFLVGVFAKSMKALRDQHEVYVAETIPFRVQIQAKTANRALDKAEKILLRCRLPVAEEIAAEVASFRMGNAKSKYRSLNDAIDAFGKRYQRDPANVRQRDWYSTRPVAHLAMGFLAAVDWKRNTSIGLMDFMFGNKDSEWVENAIEYSNTFLEQLLSAKVINDAHLPVVIRTNKVP